MAIYINKDGTAKRMDGAGDGSLYAPVTSIATPENEATSSKAYAVGEMFIRGGKLCTCIVAISSGDTLVKDTNYKEGDVGSVLTELNSNISAAVNVYGSKNLLLYPYLETTHTENGITWTDNGDGSVTANGTATALEIFTFCNFTTKLKNGSYRFSGCPDSASTNGYYLNLAYNDPNNNTQYISNVSGDTVFTINGGYGTPDYALASVGIVINQGTTVNNLTFKPMIRDARITDPTWVPWAMTNRQLTESVGDNWSFTELNAFVKYAKRFGMVCVKIVTQNTNGSVATYGALPVGYRPSDNVNQSIYADGTSYVNVWIDSYGAITMKSNTNAGVAVMYFPT